jgi:hypothetical protein
LPQIFIYLYLLPCQEHAVSSSQLPSLAKSHDHQAEMHATTLAVLAALFSQALGNADNDKVYKHVALLSIDGMHASDLPRWLSKSPKGAIASLYKHSYWYSGALTSGPSDSFPGTMNLVTGGKACSIPG